MSDGGRRIPSSGFPSAGRTVQRSDDVTNSIRDIIAQVLELEPHAIDLNASLVDDLGMDSMMALEILAAVEKRFKIKIAEENLQKMTTLRKIVEVATKHVRP